jgi:gluconokinase
MPFSPSWRRIWWKEGRDGHFMEPGLVDSQFGTLEPPDGESGVLTLDPGRPVEELVEAAAGWAEAEV